MSWNRAGALVVFQGMRDGRYGVERKGAVGSVQNGLTADAQKKEEMIKMALRL